MQHFIEYWLVISVVVAVLNAGCLWVGMMIMGVEGTFFTALAIAVFSSLISVIIPISALVPGGQWLTMAFAQLAMLCWLTDAQIWPEGVMIVVIAQVVGTIGGRFLMGIISKTLVPAM